MRGSRKGEKPGSTGDMTQNFFRDDDFSRCGIKTNTDISAIIQKSFVQSQTASSNKVGIFGVMLTLIGTIVGGGVVGIPFATLKTGIWLGLAIHLFNFIGGIYSVHLLLETKNFTGLASFSEIGFFWFGRFSIFLINGLVAIAWCGMPIAYFMIVGDVGSGLLSRITSINDTFWSDNIFPILVFAVLFFYFILKKEIQELKGTGFILVAGVVIFAVVIGIKLIIDGPGDVNIADFQKPRWDLELLANIPTMFLSYAFQSAFYPAYQSLKSKSDRNAIKATIGSFTFVVLIYVSISVVSLIKYGNDLKGDVLQNVSSESGAIPIILEVLFLIIASITIPIVLFVGREAVLIIIDELLRKSYSKAPRPIVDSSYELISSYIRELEPSSRVVSRNPLNDEGKQYLSMSPWIFYSVSILLYCGIVACAWFLHDITIVFGVIGSTAGSFLIFIAPAAFYLRSASIEKIEIPWLKIIAAWMYLIIGFAVFGGCMFATIYTATD